MSPDTGRFRFDPLQVFAVSVAACFAAGLFLLAVLADVSPGTAATRAILSWVVLSLIGLGMTLLVRWVLHVPPPRQ